MSTPDTQMNQYLTTIAEAVHGRDMRAAIHDGMEKTYNDSYTWFNQSLGNANQALQKATEALEIAEPMGDDIQEVKDLAEDLDTRYDETNERVNNIIAHNQDTQGNSELIDLRTTYDGQIKTSAGTAVRSQISNLHSRINNLVREQSTGELEDCHAKPVYVALYENQYPSSAFAAQTLQLSLPGSPVPSLAKYAFIKITFKDSNLFGAGIRSVYIPNPGKDAEGTTAYTNDGYVVMPADGTYGLSSYARKFTAALSSNDTVLNIMFTNCEKITTDNPFAIDNSDMTISDPSSTTTTDNEYLIPYEVFLIDYVLDGEVEVDKDTELIDIRNADDGTTYQSAGAAVRGQVVSAKNKTANTQKMIAPLYSVSGTYAAGDYVNYTDKLYKAKQAISSEALTASHWDEVNVMDEVDSDVGELKSALTDFVGNEYVKLTEDYYVNTSGSTIDTSSPTSNNTYSYAVVDCAEGDAFKIKLYGNPSTATAWCFIDSSNNKLTYATKESYDGEYIYAPTNAAKVVFNNRDTFLASPYIIKNTLIRDELKDIKYFVEPKEAVTATATEGYYIATDGNPSSNAKYGYLTYNLTIGDVVDYTASVADAVTSGLSIYDTDGNFIKNVATLPSGSGYTTVHWVCDMEACIAKSTYYKTRQKYLVVGNGLRQYKTMITDMQDATMAITKQVNADYTKALVDKVACIGDSMTQGYDGDQYITDNYPHMLKTLSPNWVIDNLGHGGFSASDYWTTYASVTDYSSYDTAIIYLGLNAGLVADGEETAYRNIINKLLTDNPIMKIFLCKLHGSGYIDDSNAVIESVATDLGLDVIDLSVMRTLTYDSTIHPHDNIHFSKKGYFIMTEIIYKSMCDIMYDNLDKYCTYA